ncbi:glycosyltransferase [uncultured Flavobacterium sp.]|uniref:glycosyltransferase n=1 Tax=uncultured Flavobacterium sp. TaxID=165435 RepID=UPI0025DC00E2|nr:glycosyltransferase [uncultured Flavobacterium sp.]
MSKIYLITPSLNAGGAERVMSELANYFVGKPGIDVTVIAMTRGELFYKLDAGVKFIQPDFDHRSYSRPVFTYKIYKFLRNELKAGRPDITMSFGGKYNSFALLAARGLNIRTFVSDRSRPTISYGKLLDFLNPIMYKRATGIIAQTGIARDVLQRKTGHKNIKVIGNPIKQVENTGRERTKTVINVGRFIASKHQDLMVDYFAAVNDGTWELVFLGDGQYFTAVKEKVETMGLTSAIRFPGMVANISDWYNSASIFAFTTTSEGFPNALGEAMSAGMACMSFDCVAGPADLIDNEVNGFLVKEYDHENFKEGLKKLMDNAGLRETFGQKAVEKLKKFDREEIAEEFLTFLLKK